MEAIWQLSGTRDLDVLMLRRKLQHLSIEEFANTITHGFGFLLSLVGFVVLLILAGLRGDGLSIAGCLIYGLSLILLYAASTSYHSTNSLMIKKRLQIADHCGIYLLIAGSYTPFGLVIIKGSLGQELLIAIWTCAVLGIILKIIVGNRFAALSVISYLAMGWIGAFAIEPLFAAVGTIATALVIGGGIAYSLGVVFFAWKHFRHHHAIFHVFILAGSILHYIAVVLYVVPYRTD